MESEALIEQIRLGLSDACTLVQKMDSASCGEIKTEYIATVKVAERLSILTGYNIKLEVYLKTFISERKGEYLSRIGSEHIDTDVKNHPNRGTKRIDIGLYSRDVSLVPIEIKAKPRSRTAIEGDLDKLVHVLEQDTPPYRFPYAVLAKVERYSNLIRLKGYRDINGEIRYPFTDTHRWKGQENDGLNALQTFYSDLIDTWRITNELYEVHVVSKSVDVNLYNEADSRERDPCDGAPLDTSDAYHHIGIFFVIKRKPPCRTPKVD